MGPPVLRRPPNGFTLLEVLLALGMLALVISLIQGVYSGTTRSRQASRETAEETHAAAFVLHRLADELAMAYLDPARTAATGLLVNTDSDEVSSVAFTTRVPPVSGFSSGGDAEVAYFVESDGDGGQVLQRRESADLDGDLASGGETYLLIEGLARFTVECYDGERWLTGWDSAERADPPRLPLSARITLAWRSPDGETERVYRTATPIYSAVEHP
ncbi:MAG: type II secretion system protein GspJ [Deferrisomatales bacterium]|nr:type II secretion system protein GspJ [Deferrisomatales bacterium]